MIDELRGNPRILKVLLDERGVLLVILLHTLGRRGLLSDKPGAREKDESCQDEGPLFHAGDCSWRAQSRALMRTVFSVR